MSDFLTRMVQRQRGELPLLQPRIAPMFAPQASLEPERLPETDWLSTPPDGRMQEPGSTEEAPGRMPPAKWATSDLPVRPFSVAARPGQDQEQSVQHMDDSSAAPSESKMPMHPKPPAPVSRLPMHPIPPPFIDPARPGHSATARPRATKSDPEPSHAPEPDQRGIAEHRVRTLTVKPPPRLVPQETDPQVDWGSPPPSLAAADPVKPSRNLPREAVEPPVLVTIGRIEVSAVSAPPAPRPKKVAPKPAMSLQNYLARRQGRTP